MMYMLHTIYTLYNVLYAVSDSCLPVLGHVPVLPQDAVACQYVWLLLASLETRPILFRLMHDAHCPKRKRTKMT